MGYRVDTTGRVLLPREREGPALQALKSAVADREGWFDPDDAESPATSLAELTPLAASASVVREGDWLVLTTDDDGDPKWSEQTTAFYVELARWVGEGTVAFVGEDDAAWTYTYSGGALAQAGVNGWDGSAVPFGDPVEDEPATPPPRQRRWFGRR